MPCFPAIRWSNPGLDSISGKIIKRGSVSLCDVSNDQYYAYQICWSIMHGVSDPDLQLLKVGRLSHSRWLTLGCRILRQYVSQDKPNLTLVLFTEFCTKE